MDWVKGILTLLGSLATIVVSQAQTTIPVDSNQVGRSLYHYDTDNGLLHNTVKKIAFDNAGFMWIVSEKGISRFDGKNFRHYPSGEIAGHHKSIGYIDKNLYTTSDKMILLDKGQFLTQFDLDRSDFRENAGGQYLKITQLEKLKKPYPRVIDKHYYRANDSSFFALARKSDTLEYFQKDSLRAKWKIKIFRKDFVGTSILYSFVWKEHFFNVTNDNLIEEYDANGLVREFSIPKEIKFHSLIWSDQDWVFISTGESVYQLSFDEYNEISLKLIVRIPGIRITQAARVNDKLYYVGTGRNGLYRVQFHDINSHHSTEYPEANSSRSVFEVGQDSLLNERGLLSTPKGFTLLKDADVPLLFDDSLTTMVFEKDYWRDSTLENENMLMSIKYSGQILKDSNGRYWCAGNRGLMKIKPNKFEVIFDEKHLEIIRVSQYNPFTHSIWRFFRNGVRVYNINEERFESIPALEGIYFRGVYFEEDGKIWITTYGQGLKMWDGEQLHSFPSDLSGALDYCHFILEDERNFFWISTDNGLIKVSKNELLHYIEDPATKPHFYRFDKSYGMVGNEFNGRGNPSGRILRNGRFAFASQTGPVSFDPLQLNEAIAQFPIVLDGFKIDDKDTSISSLSSLTQDFEQLEFHVSYPYYYNSSTLGFEYRIEGLHEHWYSIPENRKISIGSLDYGQYELQIRRRNGFGEDNYSFLNYPLFVQMRYYQTLGFKIFASAAVLLIIISLFFLNNWLGKLKRLRLEKIIHEKTHEQLVLNEELKLNLAKVKKSQLELEQNNSIKDRFMAMYTHHVRGPLRFIHTIAKSSAKQYDNIEKDEMVERLGDIETSIDGVYELTEKMFRLVRNEQDSISIEEKEFELSDFLENMCQSFEAEANKAGIHLNYNWSSTLKLKSEPNILSIVLSNVLDNAIKHSKANAIEIGTFELKDHVVISIKDNGQGIPPMLMKELESSTDDEQSEGTHVGFGLKTNKELLKVLKGHMEIESSEKGTSISIFIHNHKLSDEAY